MSVNENAFVEGCLLRASFAMLLMVHSKTRYHFRVRGAFRGLFAVVGI